MDVGANARGYLERVQDVPLTRLDTRERLPGTHGVGLHWSYIYVGSKVWMLQRDILGCLRR